MYKLFMSHSAELETEDIIGYYEQIQATLGMKFFAYFYDACELLQQNPFLYQKVLPNVYRAFVKGFPFKIFYTINERHKEIEVIAVIHNKRGIQYIKNRLGFD